MHALLSLPDVDQLQLTEAELAGVTGTPQHKLQIDWLRLNGWAFSLTRSGRPVVGRMYANLKLSGVEVSTIMQPQEWTPNVEAIGS